MNLCRRLNEVYATANCELADAEHSSKWDRKKKFFFNNFLLLTNLQKCPSCSLGEKLAKRVSDLIERQDELLLTAR
jgi:hypothetical protein